MKYFSLRDIKQKKPFDFEPERVELSLFLSFYVWWNELSIPKLSSLATDAAKVGSTEELYELCYKAKKEYPLLEKPLFFFPDWSIFSSLNEWLNNVLSEHFNPIRRIIESTIERTGPQKLTILNSQYMPTGLDKLTAVNPKYEQLANCVDLHALEVQRQPKLKRPKDAYKLARVSIKDSEYAIEHFRQHRQRVCQYEHPKGEPYLVFFGSASFVHYGPASREEQRIFDQRLNRIDADMSAEQARHKKLSKNLRNQFFLAKKDEDQTEFQQAQQDRTEKAVGIKINTI